MVWLVVMASLESISVQSGSHIAPVLYRYWYPVIVLSPGSFHDSVTDPSPGDPLRLLGAGGTERTRIVNVRVPILPSASCAVTVAVNVPASVGVPLIIPLDEIVIPNGAPANVYVYGH